MSCLSQVALGPGGFSLLLFIRGVNSVNQSGAFFDKPERDADFLQFFLVASGRPRYSCCLPLCVTILSRIGPRCVTILSRLGPRCVTILSRLGPRCVTILSRKQKKRVNSVQHQMRRGHSIQFGFVRMVLRVATPTENVFLMSLGSRLVLERNKTHPCDPPT